MLIYNHEKKKQSYCDFCFVISVNAYILNVDYLVLGIGSFNPRINSWSIAPLGHSIGSAIFVGIAIIPLVATANFFAPLWFIKCET